MDTLVCARVRACMCVRLCLCLYVCTRTYVPKIHHFKSKRHKLCRLTAVVGGLVLVVPVVGCLQAHHVGVVGDQAALGVQKTQAVRRHLPENVCEQSNAKDSLWSTDRSEHHPLALCSVAMLSFSYQAPVVWNQLPVSVRHSTSVSSFKYPLKTFLLKIKNKQRKQKTVL